ncbi:hypothetical protein HDE68_003614 [Pedobacter cryoconitis]|uniref:Uncharacterized protein n=1 Tax=Pedobacter cryoconitis TaxID=188932 RepID=A0A7W9E0U7_9SPHI|nr:hypothetical protein [Pedobacter cryoconitis]MBB5637689.1 hypothetical protein [Pedobacter cryoconitis]
MINRIIAIGLLIALMSSGFSRLFVYTSFELNQQYIATTLCENRDKPQMHCNGKCYLAKKLKQAEEKEKRQAENNFKKSFQNDVFLDSRFSFSPLFSVLKRNTYKNIRFDLPQSNTDILHPPPAAFHLS